MAAEREFILWFTFTDPTRLLPMNSRQLEPKDAPTDAEIQHAAYLLWVEEGRPEGRDQQHWRDARELLTHRAGRTAVRRRPLRDVARAPRR